MIARVALAALLIASTAQALTVKLAWDAPTTGIPDGYTLYRRRGTSQYELLANIAPGTLTYTDTTAAIGEQCYVVHAWNSGGESPPSNEVCYIGVAAPGPPVHLRLAP